MKKLTILLFVLQAGWLAAQIRYVKPGGTGNGTSWNDAYNELQVQMALDELQALGGGQVWIAAGTYYPTESTDRNVSFILRNNVQVMGGFAGNESTLERNWYVNQTILSGNIGNAGDDADNSYHVVVASGVSSLVEGVIIEKGNGYPLVNGGGMHISNSIIDIRHSIIRNNQAADYGGGIYVETSEAQISNSLILGNTTQLVFSTNNTRGGGVYGNENHLLQFRSCTISKNSAQFGSGIRNYSNTSTLDLKNSIIWGNVPTGNEVVSNSIATSSNIVGITGYLENLDPQFVDYANNDFRLTCGSPALNTGDNSYVSASDKDLQYADRIKSTTTDMGCFESPTNICCLPHGFDFIATSASGTAVPAQAFNNITTPAVFIVPEVVNAGSSAIQYEVHLATSPAYSPMTDDLRIRIGGNVSAGNPRQSDYWFNLLKNNTTYYARLRVSYDNGQSWSCFTDNIQIITGPNGNGRILHSTTTSNGSGAGFVFDGDTQDGDAQSITCTADVFGGTGKRLVLRNFIDGTQNFGLPVDSIEVVIENADASVQYATYKYKTSGTNVNTLGLRNYIFNAPACTDIYIKARVKCDFNTDGLREWENSYGQRIFAGTTISDDNGPGCCSVSNLVISEVWDAIQQTQYPPFSEGTFALNTLVIPSGINGSTSIDVQVTDVAGDYTNARTITGTTSADFSFTDLCPTSNYYARAKRSSECIYGQENLFLTGDTSVFYPISVTDATQTQNFSAPTNVLLTGTEVSFNPRTKGLNNLQFVIEVSEDGQFTDPAKTHSITATGTQWKSTNPPVFNLLPCKNYKVRVAMEPGVFYTVADLNQICLSIQQWGRVFHFATDGCIPKSLQTNEAEEGISLWPNPMDQGTNLKVSSDQDEDLKVEITSLSGQVVEVIHATTNQEIQIGEHILSSGVYLVKLNYGTESKQLKLIRK